MALSETLRFLVEADTTRAEANLKSLGEKAKEVERLEQAMLRLQRNAGRSPADLLKFNNAVSSASRARVELDQLTAAAAKPIGPLNKLGTALQLGIAGGVGVEAVRGIVQGLSTVATFAADQIGQAVNEASALQQSAASVDVVFGNASRAVERFGESSATSVGLSTAAFNQNATAMGSLLKAAGFANDETAELSVNLVQIAADLGAVANISTQQSALGISALLRGEFDTAEKLGTNIKQSAVDARIAALGLSTATEALKANARARAALSLLEEQAGNKRGQFAARENTLLGQQQRFTAELANARAELGTALLPALTSLVEVSREAIPVIANLGGAFRGVVDDAEAAVDAFERTQTALLGLGAGTKRVDIGKSIQNALLASPIGSSIAVVAKNYKEAADEAKRLDESSKFFDRLGLDIKNGVGPLAQFTNYIQLLPPKLQEVAFQLLGITDATQKAALGFRDLKIVTDEFGKVNDTLFGVSDAFAKFSQATADEASAGESATAAARRKRDSLRQVEDATRSLTDAQEALNETLIERFLVALGASSDEVTEAQIAERESTRSLALAKLDLIDAEERLNRLRNTGGLASRLEAQAAFIEAQKALAEAQASGDVAGILRAKAGIGKAQEGLQDTSSATQARQLQRAEIELAAAQDKVTSSGIEQRKSQQELLDTINRGKEGSKELAEANRAVEDAARRVEDAQRSLSDAQEDAQEALNKTSRAAKTLEQRFIEGRAAAQSLINYLIEKKAGPEEFAKAFELIGANLGGVAKELGKTAELDAYIAKLQALNFEFQVFNGQAKVLSAPAPKGGTTSATSTPTGTPQQIVIEIGGSVLAKAMVDESIRQGGLPIRIRASN